MAKTSIEFRDNPEQETPKPSLGKINILMYNEYFALSLAFYVSMSMLSTSFHAAWLFQSAENLKGIWHGWQRQNDYAKLEFAD